MFYVEKVLKAVIITFGARIFFDIFEQKDESAVWRKYVFTAVSILGLFLCGLMPDEWFWIRILVAIFIMALSMFFYRGLEFRNTLYLTVFYYVFVLTTGYTEGILEETLVLSDKENGAILSVAVALFCTLLLIPIVYLLKGIMNRRAAMFSLRKEWFAFFWVPLFTMVFIVMKMNGFEMTKWVEAVVLYGLAGCNILLFYIFSDLTKKQKLLIRERILKKELERNLEAFEPVNQALEQQRSRSHEFKNYINCIYYMVELKQYDELHNFVCSVRSNMHKKNEAIYHTGNLLADAIINAKYKEALAADIVFEVETDSLEDLFIKDEDVVIILSNLLNNAMEAVVKCEEDRRIRLKIKEEKGGLRIVAENTHCNAVKAEGEVIYTSKEDASNHGFGIGNIKVAVAKYEGSCDISYTQNEFVVNIFLHSKSQEK